MCSTKMAYHLMLLALLRITVHANQFDPHVYEHRGPFFEGWYVRVVDLDKRMSFGILWGMVEPSTTPHGGDNAKLVCASILYSNGKARSPLLHYDVFPNSNDVHVSVNEDQSAVYSPDKVSFSNFEWIVGKYINITIKPRVSILRARTSGGSFEVTVGEPTPWSRGAGVGPMGLLEYLPFPLYWFVYSTRSRVIDYKLTDAHGRRIASGGGAGAVFAHLENNWGASFPGAWIWAQGFGGRHGNVTFTLTYGPVSLFREYATLTGFLVGYRNPERSIALDFTNVDSVADARIEGCEGRVILTLTGFVHSIRFILQAHPESFSTCLWGPMSDGFARICTQSFVATAQVTVWRRGLLPGRWNVIDSKKIQMAALEFGGKYSCPDKGCY